MARITTTNRLQLRGFTLLEVLITLFVVAFGLLALVNLQVKMQMNEVESYQRAQAVTLLHDMTGRMQSASLRSAADVDRLALYETPEDEWLGFGDTPGDAGRVDCADIADPGVNADCDGWEALLRGAAAVTQGGSQIGAMIGARGCVEQVQPGDPTNGVCQPAVYRVSVAWQGLVPSAVPDELCGADQFGAEANRRVVSALVSIGTPGCL